MSLDQSTTERNLAGPLRQLAQVADSLGLTHARDEAVATANRIAERRFYVACVGQFKRGKSTLIDALLHDPILPAGILPVTAIPTIVRYGETRAARVRFARADVDSAPGGLEDGWLTIDVDDLRQYVSDEQNPGNVRGVLAVEAFVPSPLLVHGMCLVDTPGLGSAFGNNTEATLAFIPQIDAAIVVIGADPPITGDELDLVADVGRQVDTLLLVLNKSDRVTAEERATASAFARTLIERRIQRSVAQIYEISAAERLAGAGPPRDWDGLVAALESISRTSASTLVRDAGLRTVAHVGRELLAAVREQQNVLRQSSDENDRYIARLEDIVQLAERSVQDLSALFMSEQHRLSQRLAAERTDFLRDAAPRAEQRLNVALDACHGHFGPRVRRNMMRAAQDTARDVLDPWFSQQQQTAEVAFRDAMARFIHQATSLVDRLASTDVTGTSLVQHSVNTSIDGLDSESRFVFNDVIHVAEPASPFRFGADVAIGLLAPRTLRASAHNFLGWLLEMNSSRVQSDVEERMQNGRERLERAIRHSLSETLSRAQQSVHHAREVQGSGAVAVAAELTALAKIEASVTSIVAVVPATEQIAGGAPAQ